MLPKSVLLISILNCMLLTYRYFCFGWEFFETHWLMYFCKTFMFLVRKLFLERKEVLLFSKGAWQLKYLHHNIIQKTHQEIICPMDIKNHEHTNGGYKKKRKAIKMFWKKASSFIRLVSFTVCNKKSSLD